MGWGDHQRVGNLPVQDFRRGDVGRGTVVRYPPAFNNVQINNVYVNRDYDRHFRRGLDTTGKVLLGITAAAVTADAIMLARQNGQAPVAVDPNYVPPEAYGAEPPAMDPGVAQMFNALASSPDIGTRNAAANLVNRPMFQQLAPYAQMQLLQMINGTPWTMPQIVGALNSCFRDPSGVKLGELQQLLSDGRFPGMSAAWKGQVLNSFSLTPPNMYPTNAFNMLNWRR